VFITHNPHHAYPVGDRFLLLKRGRSLGDFAKDEIGLDELTRLMAGGAELEALGHELQRGGGAAADVARAIEADLSATPPPDGSRPAGAGRSGGGPADTR
jgi:simple sugar transport system ATP-binding protein